MSEDKQKEDVETAEERETAMDQIAEKVVKKLRALEPTPIHAYSACPQCGYQFITQLDEDKHDACPNCNYQGRTVKLRWGNE